MAAAAHAAAAAVGPAGLQLELVEVENPKELNFILGQAHFIKTVEDIYEACFQASPSLKFGIAFCEASGDRKVRFDGNRDDLVALAKQNAMKIGAGGRGKRVLRGCKLRACVERGSWTSGWQPGHSFIIFIDDGYPVNILTAIKACPTVCRVYCATANPTAVLVAKSGEERRGIAGARAARAAPAAAGPAGAAQSCSCVLDGFTPLDFENEKDQEGRLKLLQMIGYKR
eukprot:scaffold9.g3264.t1